MKKQLLGITGSLRGKSFNRSLMGSLIEIIGSRADVQLADIGSIPHYNGDLDTEDKPASVKILAEQLRVADALVIVTPEYNYSIPGVLKNAIDWMSRPAYRSPLAHKPTLILGASPSPIGSARAQAHLRQILAGTITPVFQHADFLVGAARTKFDEAGNLSDASTREHLAKFIDGFLGWVEKGAQGSSIEAVDPYQVKTTGLGLGS